MSKADIATKLDLVITLHLCPIVHELTLVFVLRERTVTATYVESITEIRDRLTFVSIRRRGVITQILSA